MNFFVQGKEAFFSQSQTASAKGSFLDPFVEGKVDYHIGLGFITDL
jgi:hypothetical protein